MRNIALFVTLIWAATSGYAGVDVNTATEPELDGVRGLGPASTARILTARSHSPFKDWADFMARVKGIKAATARKLSNEGLTVNDVPYPASAPHRPAPEQ